MSKRFQINTNVKILSFLLALKDMGIEEVFFDEGTKLRNIMEEVRNCKMCALSRTRNKVVFGEGKIDAEVMFIGEAPGEEEDMEGRPFVGKAGKLLTQLMEDVGIRRTDAYICNVLKCRPPNNRDPEKEEIEACKDYLFRQIEFVRPKVIVALGRHAYNTLFNTDERITKVRGQVRELGSVKVLATYHPSFLLRNEGKIKEAVEDLEKVKTLLLSP